jgi:hypothetical protein
MADWADFTNFVENCPFWKHERIDYVSEGNFAHKSMQQITYREKFIVHDKNQNLADYGWF